MHERSARQTKTCLINGFLTQIAPFRETHSMIQSLNCPLVVVFLSEGLTRARSPHGQVLNSFPALLE